MNPLDNCLLLIGLPLGTIFAGYWLAAGLRDATASERLAVSVLAGLSLALWSVATVNYFKPLNGIWPWLCLWPIVITIVRPGSLAGLWRDVVTVGANRRSVVAALLGTAGMVLLLWPLLSRPALVFYDGTSNHDSFFWISAAEHLKRHTYIEMPVTSQVHPLTNTTPAIIGWRPSWGRMGAEGLLALTSSLVGLAPLKLYLAASAALVVPWIAAVFLAVRTFWVGRLGVAATLSLIVLQPVFVFFHGNANLPNLIGALSAAAVVIATEQSLRPGRGRWVWLTLLAFGFHGLLCSYPEMIPFVILPGGLLWLRAWFVQSPRLVWRPALATALAWIGGAALNPASSVRAWCGYFASYDAARANKSWANLFDPLSGTEYVPALATLAVGASRGLGPILGALLTVALIVGAILAIRRATTRMSALFTLAGSAALLVYTILSGFNYGWQKTVQFGGALWAALLPVVVIDALARCGPADRRMGYVTRAALVGVIGFFAYATVLNSLDGHKWSRRKILTQDWFSVREYSRQHLAGAPVLIEGASFRMAFFHGMWASYFLAPSEIYFGARGEEAGGYLRAGVINEANTPIPEPVAVLVGREWADAFDGNSDRLVNGDTVALLKHANRVAEFSGFQPTNGVPENMEARASIDLRPHSRSQLRLKLDARYTGVGATEHWQVTNRVEGEPPFSSQVSGRPPWIITVPLTPGKLNHVEFVAGPVPPPDPLPPFALREMKIEPVRE